MTATRRARAIRAAAIALAAGATIAAATWHPAAAWATAAAGYAAVRATHTKAPDLRGSGREQALAVATGLGLLGWAQALGWPVDWASAAILPVAVAAADIGGARRPRANDADRRRG